VKPVSFFCGLKAAISPMIRDYPIFFRLFPLAVRKLIGIFAAETLKKEKI